MNGLPKGHVECGIYLQVREEGEVVNAYLAETDNPAKRDLIASIAIACLRKDRRLYDEWVAALNGFLERMIRTVTGIQPSMISRKPPEAS